MRSFMVEGRSVSINQNDHVTFDGVARGGQLFVTRGAGNSDLRVTSFSSLGFERRPNPVEIINLERTGLLVVTEINGRLQVCLTPLGKKIAQMDGSYSLAAVVVGEDLIAAPVVDRSLLVKYDQVVPGSPVPQWPSDAGNRAWPRDGLGQEPETDFKPGDYSPFELDGEGQEIPRPTTPAPVYPTAVPTTPASDPALWVTTPYDENCPVKPFTGVCVTTPAPNGSNIEDMLALVRGGSLSRDELRGIVTQHGVSMDGFDSRSKAGISDAILAHFSK